MGRETIIREAIKIGVYPLVVKTNATIKYPIDRQCLPWILRRKGVVLFSIAGVRDLSSYHLDWVKVTDAKNVKRLLANGHIMKDYYVLSEDLTELLPRELSTMIYRNLPDKLSDKLILKYLKDVVH